MSVNGRHLRQVLLTTTRGESVITVGEWKLDELKAIGALEITPDQTGINTGTLSGEPYPILVKGKNGNGMQFSGENAIYIPIKFVVGFPSMDERCMSQLTLT
ncbi:MAG: hypothetical protein GX799_00375 [Crenarchaeota archaeon]|jgi:hypothetical protein|nr:hypothetical protein [Thermoproteota archaeon]